MEVTYRVRAGAPTGVQRSAGDLPALLGLACPRRIHSDRRMRRHDQVHGVGHPYNWTASKRASAAGLRAVVTEAGAVASKEAERLNRQSMKSILVTHSMGGLVACGYTQLLGKAADVHSVIHGAMPTHGSPELYKRIRGGFEGATRHVLGSDQLRSLPRRRTCPVRWNWHRTESTRISLDASLGCGHLTA